jgi:tetratricopeptide (TPR) repeat protein/predicted Ser/Thr protein kinase
MPAPLPGSSVSHYRVLQKLAAGGMGEVYLAEDVRLRRQVALKVLPEDLTADVERRWRFVQEARAAAAIDHPHIAAVYDIDEVEGRTIIAMEYVRGQSLRDAIAVRRLDIRPALELAVQVAEALTKAHERGVVHRDLKPENIMVSEDGYAKIIDFGLAKLLEPVVATMAHSASAASPDEETDTRTDLRTETGRIMGTVAYMSPEQARGQPVDARSDIFSFGVVLYEMLSGHDPFKRPSSIETLSAILRDTPPPLLLPAARTPPELQRILLKSLAKDPADRYQQMKDMAADLRALRERVSRGNYAGAEGRLPAWARTWSPAAAALALVLLAVAAWWWLLRPPRAPVPHEPLSVLVADFENRTGDAVFEGALEQALSIGIEGASFITSYPRDAALRVAGQIRPGSKLDEPTARLVSVREGIKIILVGGIALNNGAYAISVQAVDPAVGDVLNKAQASAPSKAEVLPVMASLAARLRGTLGDTTPESARLAAAETFTVASVEAARDFSLAQQLASAGKDEEAIVHYKRALEQDPKFGRAYAAWGVSASKLGRTDESAEAYKKAFQLMDRMTEREKYRTLGTYYLSITRNYEKAIENYTTLVELYPADRAGHSNLALAYFYVLNLRKALEEARASVAIYPKNATFRNNYALYAMYAGDFSTAAAEATRVIEQDAMFHKAYLPLAMAALVKGDTAAARAAYGRMAKAGPRGQSLASAGLADLAMYEGRFTDAEAALMEGLAVDETARSTSGLASKYVALAEAYQAIGRTEPAIQASQSALKLARDESAAFPAAGIYLAAGRSREARELAAALEGELQPRTRAYGRLIAGEIARRGGRRADAVSAFREAQQFADVWMRRFNLGVAYIEAGHFAEALSELEICLKRQGEATAVFLDDVPTFRYMAPLRYWLGRAQEGLGMKAQAAESYKSFLALRPASASDPRAGDARRRLEALGA